jgi:lysophospholipase
MLPPEQITADGLHLRTYHWPVDKPRAFVLLIHGMGEHLGRYEHVAKALNAAGLAVVGQDHRGHGASEGERAFFRTVDTLVDDLSPLWAAAQGLYAGLPACVVGHSLGGLVATHFALRHQADIRALALSGAALLLTDDLPAPLVSLLIALGRIFPRSRPIPAIPSKYLSHDPAISQSYDGDAEVSHERVYLGVVAAMSASGRAALARAESLRLPLLAMHGGDDKIIPPLASQALIARAGAADKTLKIYPSLYHEIFNELEKEAVLTDLVAWLSARLYNKAS